MVTHWIEGGYTATTAELVKMILEDLAYLAEDDPARERQLELLSELLEEEE